jgi:ELWxxDGT repeat protein
MTLTMQRLARPIPVLLAFACLPSIASSAPAYRVKDINPGPGTSVPEYLTDLNGTLFFAAADGELWKSNATEVGTVQVAEIAPGGLKSNPVYLTVFNGMLFFSANDGTHGRELWRSDGTAPGTVMVADINPSGDSAPTWLTVWNGALYFGADDGVHGHELWKSDGTPGGTAMLKDIWPNAGSSSPSPIGAAGGSLFLAANDGTWGRELWKTDGTTGGTALVKDLASGMADSSPTLLSDLGNGTALFFADDTFVRRELFRTDGTFFGTSLVADVNPSPGEGCAVREARVFGGTLYFVATGGPLVGFELWRSDGSGAALIELNPGGNSSDPHSLTVVGDRLFFGATTPTHTSSLWVTDGTSAPDELYENFFGIGPSVGTGLAAMANVRGRLFFRGSEGGDDELWSTNGRLFGASRVQNVNPVGNSNPSWLTASGGRLFFSADDGVSGRELWATDAIFDNGFEIFFLAPPFDPWSNQANDCPGECDMDIVGPGLDGSLAMQAFVNDTNPLYVVDETPADEDEYHARFLFDPNGFDPGEAQGRHRTRIFLGFSDPPQRRLITLVLARNNGAYRIILRTRRDDGTTVDLPGVSITDAPHALEVTWNRSSAPGANDGVAELWIDDVLVGTLPGVDNDTGAIGFVRLGAMSIKPGALGGLVFDRFESRRFRHIGP